jgi:glycine cleavage system H protein
VKAVSELFAPLGGEVVAVNDALADRPELVNDSPYDQGWMLLIKPSDRSQLAALLDVKAYEALVATLAT